MEKIDGFQTTDSFRFDRNTSSSSISLSSSSGYGSRLSLLQTEHLSSSSNRRNGIITKYFKEKLSRHKSLASLVLSSTTSRIENSNSNEDTDIYDNVWNLDEQIEKFRLTLHKKFQFNDCQSIISMSVDKPKTISHRINDKDLLSAAAWYQEGLSENICEEYLNRSNQPIGAFIIRCCYNHLNRPFILSIKTNKTLIEHFFIQQTIYNDGYQIEGSSKVFINLSILVIHHTVMKENLPVRLVLPSIIHSEYRSSLGIIRSVRF